MKPQRILALQMKRIGDLILTAPALAELHRHFPDAEIELVADAPCRDLAACLPGVTRVLTYHRRRPNTAVWAAAACAEWDACLDFTGSDRSALLARLSGAGLRAGYQRFSGGLRRLAYHNLCPASVRELHTVDFHLALASELTGKPALARDLPQSELNLPPSAVARADALLREAAGKPLAVIHPGAARREKYWPAERWVTVAESLHQLGCAVVMTGAGTGLETEDLALIRRQTRAPLLDFTGQLSLVETAAVISRAQLALGVDSMAMHLAALWRVPQIVLFGPTNPFHWRPLHERAVVLAPDHEGPLTLFEPRARGGDMERIPACAVIDAAERLLAHSV